MATLAIIHTTTATLDSLRELATEMMPGVRVYNFLDDSILPQLARNDGMVAEVEERLIQYARFAQNAGADAILEACSSIGELVDKMQRAVKIPVVRIDAEMAKQAVTRGTRLGVAATLHTALRPTTALLESAGRGKQTPVSVEPVLVQGAYEKLLAGDRDGHDALVADALADLVGRVDVVVLAQASMARVLPRLPDEARDRFLTSPRFAMARVKEVLSQK